MLQKNMLSSLRERGELACVPMGSQFTDMHFKDGMAHQKWAGPHTRFFFALNIHNSDMSGVNMQLDSVQ